MRPGGWLSVLGIVCVMRAASSSVFFCSFFCMFLFSVQAAPLGDSLFSSFFLSDYILLSAFQFKNGGMGNAVECCLFVTLRPRPREAIQMRNNAQRATSNDDDKQFMFKPREHRTHRAQKEKRRRKEKKEHKRTAA